MFSEVDPKSEYRSPLSHHRENTAASRNRSHNYLALLPQPLSNGYESLPFRYPRQTRRSTRNAGYLTKPVGPHSFETTRTEFGSGGQVTYRSLGPPQLHRLPTRR